MRSTAKTVTCPPIETVTVNNLLTRSARDSFFTISNQNSQLVCDSCHLLLLLMRKV